MVCSNCAKTCKNETGLKIDGTKKGCPPILRMVRREGSPNETDEGRDQATPHRVQNLHVPFEKEVVSESQESVTEEASVDVSSNDAEDTPERAATNDDRKERISWPTSTEKIVWQAFEEELDTVLENIIAGSVDRKLAEMATIMYSMEKSRSGVQEKKEPRTKPADNRRQIKIARLRGDIRRLSKTFNTASQDERPALVELRKYLREQIASLRMAENSRKQRKMSRKRANFTANPFQFMKELLGE